ncbi:MAG: hypothetical protein SH850_25665 [Planctomycetaceae bacterium]|nr:hypothetical protein [Planctomycetaceae bacterium]
MSLATSLTLWSAFVLGQTGLPPVPLPQQEPAVIPAMTLPADTTPEQLRHIEQAISHLRGGGQTILANQLEAALHSARQAEFRKVLEAKQAQRQALEQEIAAIKRQLEQPDHIALRFTILQVDRDKLLAANAALAEQLTMRIMARGSAIPQPNPVTKPLDVAILLQRLCAATETGAVKKLSTPTVVMLDGREAKVRTGGQFPVIVGHPGQPLPRSLEFGTTLTVRPRRVTANAVHCFAIYEQADMILEDGVISTGGMVPGVTKRQIAAQFTAEFGETVMFPCPEAQPVVTLVFARVDREGVPTAFLPPEPFRLRAPQGPQDDRPSATIPNANFERHFLHYYLQKPTPLESISPVSYLLQSLMGADDLFPVVPTKTAPSPYSLDADVQYFPAPPLPQPEPIPVPQP